MFSFLWASIWLVFRSFVVMKVFIFAKSCIRALYIYKVAPAVGLNFDFTKVKGWVLVTGCTDGIGKGLVYELAKLNMKLVLVSRSADKLSALAKELQSRYGSEVLIFQFDFRSRDYQPIKQFCEQLQVDVLINNVGMAPSVLKDFLSYPHPYHEEMISVNLLSTVRMTEIFMAKMVQRNFGAVVNVSSIQGLHPIQHLANYGATKAFISYLSDCLYKSYPKKGSCVRVTCLTPTLVATKMTGYDKPNQFVIGVTDYVQDAVKAIGSVSVTTGAFIQEVQMAILQLLPWWAIELLVDPIYEMENQRLMKLHEKSN